MSIVLLLVAAFLAGGLNSIAGGGSFITFPALVFTGVPSIVANASSTVALVPSSFASAWAYREDFRKLEGIPFKRAMAVSLIGGLLGALLLLFTPQHAFDVIIPWLLAFSTAIFIAGPKLSPWLRERCRVGEGSLLAGQSLVALYGGYFGGAVGIMQLALYSVFGMTDIRQMNAMKAVLTGSMNAVAVICFVIAGKVWWTETLVMLIGAVAGGYIGARTARLMKPKLVRNIISAVSVCITVLFFLRG